MPWRALADVNLSHLPPTLAQLEPVLCIPFSFLDRACVIQDVEGDELVIAVKHLGGPKFQTTVSAIIQRQLDVTFPRRYHAHLYDVGSPDVRLCVHPCSHRHKEKGAE